MGKTFLNTWAKNDTLQIYLGKDNNIFATREEKLQNNPRSIIGNNITEETNIVITVKNNYSQSINTEVLDQVPISNEYDKVKLEVFNIENAIYDKIEGSVKWNLSLKGNETSTLNLKYILKTPKENEEALQSKKMKFRTISCPSF